MTPCTIQIEEHGDVAIVSLHGDLTHTDALRVAQTCQKILQQKFRKIIFEVSDLHHIDIDGMSGIISSYTHCMRAQAKFVLYCPQADLADLLKTTKLDTIIPVADGEISAALTLVSQ